MNRADYELANKDVSNYTSKDWTLFMEVCKKHAREKRRRIDEDDFAMYACRRKFQQNTIRIDFVFIDYLRETYGSTRVLKYHHRRQAESGTSEDFKIDNVEDYSESSRPDVLYERKCQFEINRKIVNAKLLNIKNFDHFVCMYLKLKLDLQGNELAKYTKLSETRISQITKKFIADQV